MTWWFLVGGAVFLLAALAWWFGGRRASVRPGTMSFEEAEHDALRRPHGQEFLDHWN